MKMLAFFFLLIKFSESYEVLNIDQLARFVVEQARWRNWDQIICFSSNRSHLSGKTVFLNNVSNGWMMSRWTERVSNVQKSSMPGVLAFWPQDNYTSFTLPSVVICEKKDLEDLKTALRNMSNVVAINTDLIVSSFVRCHSSLCDDAIFLEQIYKKGPFTDLTVRALGNWTFGKTPDFTLLPPEKRTGNLNVSVRVGIKNTTDDQTDALIQGFTTSIEKEEESSFLVMLLCLFDAMNVSHEVIVFPKLGWQNEEGGWVHLLGGLSEGSVDVAADTVDMTMDNVRDSMQLSNPIVKTMSCVFFKKRAGAGRFRNIVLAPFSPSLQLSVFITGVFLWLAMLIVTLLRAKTDENVNAVERKWEISEALLWTCSVLCMQGSPWAPKSLSGCILLFSSLIFALITYNSFAAFITSVLSTSDAPFKTISDLRKSEYQFGYVASSQEETFLRTVDDSDLRSLYYRGLLGKGGVKDVSEGMTRTVSESYAFFVSARFGRHALLRETPSRYRCSVMELAVSSTFTEAVIPLAKNSPFNTLINYWLIRLRETGILARIKTRILPPMPNCITGQQFHGATATDLSTAYGAFLLGLISSWIILLLEILWSRRGCIRRKHNAGDHGVRKSRAVTDGFRFQNYPPFPDYVN